MSAAPIDLVDTREMLVVHTAFRREFHGAPALVRGVPTGDVARARVVADHLDFLGEMLHVHHSGEDELLWPKLKERVAVELAPTVELMEAQHEGIHEAMDAAGAARARWRSVASAADREELAQALEQLEARLVEHLAAEEEHVLPLAARCLTPAEWAQLGEHGMGGVPRRQRTTVLGMFMLEGDPEVLRLMLSTAPPPVRVLMPRLAPRAYRRYSRRVQGSAA